MATPSVVRIDAKRSIAATMITDVGNIIWRFLMSRRRVWRIFIIIRCHRVLVSDYKRNLHESSKSPNYYYFNQSTWMTAVIVVVLYTYEGFFSGQAAPIRYWPKHCVRPEIQVAIIPSYPYPFVPDDAIDRWFCGAWQANLFPENARGQICRRADARPSPAIDLSLRNVETPVSPRLYTCRKPTSEQRSDDYLLGVESWPLCNTFE